MSNELLTHSALPDLLCCDPKNRENLDHYQNDCIHHFRGLRHFCVHLETSEKTLDALKDVHKSILACTNILSCLKNVCVTMSHAKLLKIHTERRTPMPAKITLAGENTYQIKIREQILIA